MKPGMAIQTMYSIVDMLFIGQLGGESITAVAFNMPLYFFVMGITFGIGTGLTSSISRAIGSENKERANSAAEHGIILGLILGLTLTIAGLILGKAVLSMLGAPKEMLDESWGYPELKISTIG